MSLQTIAIPPQRGQAQGLLVMLHGWGANAQDVSALASFLNLPNYQFVFPDAPFPYLYSPIGRVWYNFPENYTFLSNPEFYDQPELTQSRQQLIEWLRSLESTTGIPLSRTVLAGFSQGGAMTLDVGLKLPLAALMVLSGYIHAPARLAIGEGSASVPPVLMVHGRQDQVVPLAAAHQARDQLLALGVAVQYRELDMGHEIQPHVLRLMQSFIEETVISPDSPSKPL
ncbi:alpha/beta hydrolase [Thermocoleostomius sinensis]|uniref:Alpha/beta hydrolase n=1 Tax=Thermocoleostomius sinensis A174 TaxID=2016057 RepID=A0A9E8Z866_9CYAN|nr:alpha/beta hydrolase [Thermocoleostomius sinensis]WAL58086.1 alpha/beta hydrolase [Thermocoleostomius sinensis A174]